MSLRDDLLADIDEIRGIPGEMGLHRFQVWVRVTSYSGSRVGLGTATTSETRLLVGGQDPHVKQVKNQDLVAGADDLKEAEFIIGPLTDAYGTGGHAFSTLDPNGTNTPATTTYLIKGPGLPTSGLLCQKISDDTDSALHYTIRVKSKGRNGS